MNPESAKAIAGFLLTVLERELPTTKRVLESVPDEKLGWRPNPKGRTAGELAWHIAFSDIWFLEGIAAGKFAEELEPPAPATTAEMTAYYEKHLPAAIAKVRALSGEQLAKTIPFYVYNEPGFVYVSFAERHSIHHRGQLAAYLRAMGEKVPSIYGGSADEPFDASAAAQ